MQQALRMVVTVRTGPAVIAGAADDEAAVRELEQQCEARARVRSSSHCATPRSSAASRSRDASRITASVTGVHYGDATRLANGRMQPRKFDDLPECVTAYDARRKLNMRADASLSRGNDSISAASSAGCS